jgi:hypothetical protein
LTLHARPPEEVGRASSGSRDTESSYCAQVHEKLVPSLESAEHVDVCGLVRLPTLLISSMSADGNPIEPPIGPLVVESVA